MIVADTNVLINAWERGSGPDRRRVESLMAADQLATTAITCCELTKGATTPPATLAKVKRLLDLLRILPLTRRGAEVAAAVARVKERRGQRMRLPDALIAGICVEFGLPVLTNDVDHFAGIAGLEVVHVEGSKQGH